MSESWNYLHYPISCHEDSAMKIRIQFLELMLLFSTETINQISYVQNEFEIERLDSDRVRWLSRRLPIQYRISGI